MKRFLFLAISALFIISILSFSAFADCGFFCRLNNVMTGNVVSEQQITAAPSCTYEQLPLSLQSKLLRELPMDQRIAHDYTIYNVTISNYDGNFDYHCYTYIADHFCGDQVNTIYGFSKFCYLPDYGLKNCTVITYLNPNNVYSTKIPLTCSQKNQQDTTQPTCTDSDGGENYYTKGTVTGLELPGITDTWSDYCGVPGAVDEAGKLVEYYCDASNYGKKSLYSCPNGCSNGACINTVPSTCLVDGVAKPAVSRACTADDVTNEVTASFPNIDDAYCISNRAGGCKDENTGYLHSGVFKVNADCTDIKSFWEPSSCPNDWNNPFAGHDVSMLDGEKTVHFSNDPFSSGASIKAIIGGVDDYSQVWINGISLPELQLGNAVGGGNGKQNSDWIDVTKYFHAGDNTVKFTATDVCGTTDASAAPCYFRMFDIKWNITGLTTTPQNQLNCDNLIFYSSFGGNPQNTINSCIEDNFFYAGLTEESDGKLYWNGNCAISAPTLLGSSYKVYLNLRLCPTEKLLARQYSEGESCVGTTSLKDCEGATFEITAQDGEQRIIEVYNIDIPNKEIMFRDLLTDAKKMNRYDSEGRQIYDVGFAAAELTISADAKTITFTKINYAAEETCTDTDGGKDYTIAGSVSMPNLGVVCSDRCSTPEELANSGGVDSLSECFCEGGGQGSGWVNCPNGCEDGACIKGKPAPECDGCMYNDKCLAGGRRFTAKTEPVYCDEIQGEIIPQKEAQLKCDENFECLSNTCVRGKCVEQYGLIVGIWCKLRSFIEEPVNSEVRDVLFEDCIQSYGAE